MKTVAVGKEQNPVTIQEQVPIDSAAWRKKACFENLTKTAYDLRDSEYNFAESFSFIEFYVIFKS